MSASPDHRPGLSRRAVLSLVLLAVIALLVALPFLPDDAGVLSSTAPLRAEQQPRAGFAGASPARIFLSARERAAATKSGLVPPGTRSVIATGGKLPHGSWRWDEAGVPAGPLTVRVDLGRQLVSVFRGPDEIGTAVIVYGVEGKDTPRGKLPILGKTRDYHSITYDAPMPFSLWLREDGVALHGSSVAMGKATNGCIGVPVDFAQKLFEATREGDIIEVIG